MWFWTGFRWCHGIRMNLINCGNGIIDVSGMSSLGPGSGLPSSMFTLALAVVCRVVQVKLCTSPGASPLNCTTDLSLFGLFCCFLKDTCRKRSTYSIWVWSIPLHTWECKGVNTHPMGHPWPRHGSQWINTPHFSHLIHNLNEILQFFRGFSTELAQVPTGTSLVWLCLLLGSTLLSST